MKKFLVCNCDCCGQICLKLSLISQFGQTDIIHYRVAFLIEIRGFPETI